MSRLISCGFKQKMIAVIFLMITHSFYGSNPVVRFNYLTTQEGLSQNHIADIFQDSQGFLWIGTFNGLNRYDGYNIKAFHNEFGNDNSLSHPSVNVIYEDKTGVLWVGTEYGLNKFDESKGQFKRFYNHSNDPEKSAINDIRTIYEDNTGQLWVGFYGDGLKKFNNNLGLFEHEPFLLECLEGNTFRYVNAFYVDQESVFWIGTERNGLLRYDHTEKSIKQYSNIPEAHVNIGDSCVAVIKEDQHNKLWVGTWEGRLNIIDKVTDDVITYKAENTSELSNNSITTIGFDNERVWIGTFGGGLNILNRKDGSFSTFRHSPSDLMSLSSDVVWKLFLDKTGTLWVGTYGGGINKYLTRNNPSENYRMEQEREAWLNNNVILSFLEGKDGTIYVGTLGGGLNVFNRQAGVFSYLLEDKDLKSSTIRCLFEDDKQQLWAGTDAGVYRFDKDLKSVMHYPLSTKDGGLGPNSIYSITQDSGGNMWFGSWRNGLRRMHATDHDKRPEKVVFETFEKEIFAQRTIWSLFKDSRGDIWIGATRGLFRYSYNNKVFDEFIPDASNSTNFTTQYFSTTCFIEDVEYQKIWFGTLGNGIGEFNLETGRFRFLSSNNNTGRDEVFNIYADKNWNIWMSTTNGLAKYDVKLNDFQKISLGQSDHDELLNRLYPLASGELLIGGNKGFYVFNPLEFVERPIMSNIVFTDFRIYNTSLDMLDVEDFGLTVKSVNSVDKISLGHKANVFSIEFASLDYRAPKKIKYQYILEGFDQDWISTDAGNRLATYTNLNSGTYTFRVRATNSDGIWNLSEKSLVIKINAPWYKTLWFRIILTLVIILLLYLLFRYKMGLLKEKLELKDFEMESKRLAGDIKKTLVENDTLNEKLNISEKELAANKLIVLDKNESMVALRRQILELLNQVSASQKPFIANVLNKLDYELKDQDGWDSLKENLDILQNDFLKRLASEYPKLTQKDLKICALIILGKTNKEIADLVNISVPSVEMSRYRIRKKINLDNGASLNDFLLRF